MSKQVYSLPATLAAIRRRTLEGTPEQLEEALVRLAAFPKLGWSDHQKLERVTRHLAAGRGDRAALLVEQTILIESMTPKRGCGA